MGSFDEVQWFAVCEVTYLLFACAHKVVDVLVAFGAVVWPVGCLVCRDCTISDSVFATVRAWKR